MDMELVLKNYFSQPKVELGDRNSYVGASDVAQCPRKAVLTKTQPAAEDLQTLIRYEQGNMVERIVENALDHAGIPYDSQVKIVHPEVEHFKAHLDFTYLLPDYRIYGVIRCLKYALYGCAPSVLYLQHPVSRYRRIGTDLLRSYDFTFFRKDERAVLETKSVSVLPDAPYPSWIGQIHFQMGLAALTDTRPVRGAVMAVNLSSGDFQEFNGCRHNERSLMAFCRKRSISDGF